MESGQSYFLFTAFRHPLAALVVVLLFLFAGAAAFLYAFPPAMARSVELRIRDVPVTAALAETVFERARGLAGRSSLGENEGMLFLEPKPGRYAIWMKGMEIPIDILWIKDSRVVDIVERALPEPGVPDNKLTRYEPDVAAELTLELPAGFVLRNGISVGDKVLLIAGELPAPYRGFLSRAVR